MELSERVASPRGVRKRRHHPSFWKSAEGPLSTYGGDSSVGNGQNGAWTQGCLAVLLTLTLVVGKGADLATQTAKTAPEVIEIPAGWSEGEARARETSADRRASPRGSGAHPQGQPVSWALVDQ
jgi:hypothetical protein